MTSARVETIPVDLETARRYLNTANRMLADSMQSSLSAEARYTLAYDAARNAITAALRASGMRVTAGARSHVVTLTAAKRVLGTELISTLQRLDDMRRVRHEIEYDTREVSMFEFEAIQEPAAAIVQAAHHMISTLADV